MVKRLKNYRFWVCFPFILLICIPLIPSLLLLLLVVFFKIIYKVLELVTEFSFDFTESFYPDTMTVLIKRTIHWVRQND